MNLEFKERKKTRYIFPHSAFVLQEAALEIFRFLVFGRLICSAVDKMWSWGPRMNLVLAVWPEPRNLEHPALITLLGPVENGTERV